MGSRFRRGSGRGHILALVGLSLLVPTGSGQAQELGLGEGCDLERARIVVSSQGFGGARVTYVGGPVGVCDDGVRIQADSAVHRHATEFQTGTTQFFGRFRFIDPERTLVADTANYAQQDGRLRAWSGVVLTTAGDDTEIRGDSLTLFQGNPGVSDDRVVVRGEPAFARVLPTGASGASTDPYEIEAIQIRFEGEQALFADGDVHVVRDSLEASAASLGFDQLYGVLTLTGEARVETGGTQIEGDVVDLSLPDDEIRSLTARGSGRLQRDDLELVGDEVEIQLDAGEIQRLISVCRQPVTTAPTEDRAGPEPEVEDLDDSDRDAEPAVTLSRDRVEHPECAVARVEGFVLSADSLDARAPAGVFDTVYAVGRARAVTGTGSDTAASGDSGTAAATDAQPAGFDLALLDRDWIEGDTIIAMFAAPPAVATPADETESTGAEYEVERIVAIGRARTLYRSPPEGIEDGPSSGEPPDRSGWAIDYVLADRIVLTMENGQVARFDADGVVTGYHGEPQTTDVGANPNPEGGDPP